MMWLIALPFSFGIDSRSDNSTIRELEMDVLVRWYCSGACSCSGSGPNTSKCCCTEEQYQRLEESRKFGFSRCIDDHRWIDCCRTPLLRSNLSARMNILGALVLFIYAITSGATFGWKSADVIAPLVISVVLIPAFLFWETRLSSEMAAM